MPDAPAALNRLQLEGKEVILIGTAHISQESVAIVRQAIADEKPDAVCVELDEARAQNLRNQAGWQNLNLIQVLRKGQMPFLMANMILGAFQKRMGAETGVRPGAELAAAMEEADRHDIPVALIDRNIRTSLLRIWRTASLWSKLKVQAALLTSLFSDEALSEEDLQMLQQRDTLSLLLEEMRGVLPSVKSVLVDERDALMAQHIRDTPGDRVVAVVGAAHVPGICQRIRQDAPAEELAAYEQVPPKSALSKSIPWLIPALVILLFAGGFVFGKTEMLQGAAVAWVLANGLLSALGALLAWGHPLTIATAFVAAPITSLNPTVGAGMVTGLVQAWIAPPTVRDMERIGDELTRLTGWWRNRLARVLLVFFFSSLGSAVGTFVAFHWLKDLV